jgi:hypothetical protein
VAFDSTAPSNHPVGVSSNSGVLFVFFNLGLQGCMSFQFLKSPSVLYVAELVDGVSFSKKKIFLSSQMDQQTRDGRCFNLCSLWVQESKKLESWPVPR